MSIKYYDICDTPYKRDSSTMEISVLRKSSDGTVIETKPTPYDCAKFDRNWRTSPVIDEETAKKLVLCSSKSY